MVCHADLWNLGVSTYIHEERLPRHSIFTNSKTSMIDQIPSKLWLEF